MTFEGARNKMTHEAVKSLPAISVVVPVYNLADYVTDTVESVLSQSYSGNLSILILDDGSTDDSLAIAKKLAAKNNTITVHTQKNQGRAKTRNRLLELAETELIGWIDGDDIASPLWIEEQVLHLLSHQECAAVGGQGYAMTGNRHAMSPIEHPLSHHKIHDCHLNGHANAFFQSCVVVRKSLVLQAGAYDERFPCAEDYSLWLRLAEFGELHNLKPVHLYYRVHATSANWTANVEQRQQGQQILDEQRRARGLTPIKSVDSKIPPTKKDDWNRRIYWINHALKAGNPFSALEMLFIALRKHPFSLVLWLALTVATLDTMLCLGNRTQRFRAGKTPVIGDLPRFSFYRLGKRIIQIRRKLRGRKFPDANLRAASHEITENRAEAD